MKILQMPRFKKYVKKLPRHLQQVILDAVENVLSDIEIGELKRGDLNGFRIHKFTMSRQLILMARPLKNVPFCPISASGSNFNPQNTQCIPAVKVFAFLDLEQN